MEYNFNVACNGEEKEVTMTFGLLSDIISYVAPNGEEDTTEFQFFLNPIQQKEIVNMCLQERDENGKSKDKTDYSRSMTPPAVRDLINWVGEHVTDFLLSGLKSAANALNQNADTLEELRTSPSYPTGSED